jgi:adenine-specific DNA-methyltransferase
MPDLLHHSEKASSAKTASNGRQAALANLDIVAHCFIHGQELLTKRTSYSRKQLGQFLTPPTVARYMARQLRPQREGCRVLDPAIGSGVLACALVEQVIEAGYPTELFIDGYEVDTSLGVVARQALSLAVEKAAGHGIAINACVHQVDFVLAHTPVAQPSLFPGNDFSGQQADATYDLIIANPPYFKLNRDDPRVEAVVGQIKGHTNIYTLFMALGARLLAKEGWASFIVPRSFCSGAYFAAFRREFIKQTDPTAVHLFASRQDNFEGDDVLQENVIITFKKRDEKEKRPEQITITASRSATGLNGDLVHRQTPIAYFLSQRNGTLFFRLPVTELDEKIIETMDNWPGTLARYGLAVSTGPVVAFRAKSFLQEMHMVQTGQAVPLLWLQNVSMQQVEWPVTRGKKPQAISTTGKAQSLLIPTANYVLTRRFSAKEEPRRLTAAPFLREDFSYEQVGLENHLNYIYRKEGELETNEAIGLSALLNSALVDRYFRISNGNTQVNAAELRALPLPPLDVIRKIGENVAAAKTLKDDVIFAVLREQGCLAADFPTISETRFSMGKIQEAQDILKTLGLPRPQQNEMAALTLLVLAGLSEETPWVQAGQQSLRIHDMLGQMQTRYGRQYAENTRETIRRQVIHQFVQAGLVLHNPDDPALPTNSPRTHYALSEPVLDTLRAYGSGDWPKAAQFFLENQRALIETYRQQRDQYKVPLIIGDGVEYHLSPGAHNELQVLVIEEFGPRFAPGAKVLYVGDTANKTLHIDEAGFGKLGIPIPSHDKLPDVVLYEEERNWLYLIEAVTSHGPMSPKRQLELRELLGKGQADLIYVTVFPDFNTFKNFLLDIAWETEVWIADRPTHLIHFNGDRFLGPHSPA